jgi:hypothetical protein
MQNPNAYTPAWFIAKWSALQGVLTASLVSKQTQVTRIAVKSVCCRPLSKQTGQTIQVLLDRGQGSEEVFDLIKR